MTRPSLAPAERVALVRELVRVVATGKESAAVYSRVAPHHALVVPLPMFRPERGDRGLRALSVLVQRGLRRVEVSVEPALASGAIVAACFSLTGSHDGSLGAERPTGRRVTVTGLVTARFDPDLVDLIETRAELGLFALYRDLGVVRVRSGAATTVEARPDGGGLAPSGDAT